MTKNKIFVSVGWGVAIKSSLLSAGLTLIAFFSVEHYLKVEFDKGGDALGIRDRHQFEQLRDSHMEVQLGFIETLALADGSQRAMTLERLLGTVDANWQSMTLLNGIEALVVYDRSGDELKRYGEYRLEPQADVVASVLEDGVPRDYVTCSDYCRHLIVAPLLVDANKLVDGNKNLVLVWATSAAGLMETFSSVTGTVASLVDFSAGEDGEGIVPFVSGRARFRMPDFIALSQDYTQGNGGNLDGGPVLSTRDDRYLSLDALLLKSPKGVNELHLFWIRDVSDRIASAQQTLSNTLSISNCTALPTATV